ncbi:type VII secretion protein EccCa [Streptomyces prunicolor]|uniref:type VII secretion protein EccCa n=1 Tax=Streptomyces prunicolor TaxID=67348 RepID=UPI0033C66DE4
MSRIAFHRPARIIPPVVPESNVTLSAPPQLPNSGTGASNWLMLLLPLLSSVSMAAYMVTYGKPWMVILGITFVVLSVGLTAVVRMQMRKNNQKLKDRQGRRYFEYLSDTRKQAVAVAAEQRAAAAWRHPGPERLWALATGRRRVWERRAADDDFLRLRLGTGWGPAAVRLSLGRRDDPMAEYEPRARRAAEELVRRHARVDRQTAWIDLSRAGVLSLLGPADRTRQAARVLLGQLGVLHAPDDVRLVVCGQAEHWEWAKWLPHTYEPDATGEAGVVPLVAERLEDVADFLEQELERAREDRAERNNRLSSERDSRPGRHLVVLLDDFDPRAPWASSPLMAALLDTAGAALGIHLVCLVAKEGEEPSRVDVRARVDVTGELALEGPHPALRSPVDEAVLDTADPVLLEQIARALTPLRLSGEREQVLARTVSLPGMLDCPDLAELDPREGWLKPDDEQLLSLPIGIDGNGDNLVLDLKESAQGGHGPHGLIVGATGSGKSELLRALVTGLTMRHSPEHLGFVLVDFKGGATFAGVTELPHVSGLITNLADDLAMVDRMRAALHGEQQRRQRMLRDAGNLDSVRAYQLRQAAGGTDVHGKPLEPLPYLLIVVDEFGELLSQRSDFIDLFVQIGRVGRSLGMHLLLATQRLEEGRLRGLESHLSYRICLRTFSAAESRAVIGTADAYRLPSIPGSAYLKVDETLYERFRAAHVSGPYQDPGEAAAALAQQPTDPRPFVLRTAPDPDAAGAEQFAAPLFQLEGPTEMEVAVGQLQRFGEPAHQVWLPPLPVKFSLDSLVGPVSAVREKRGLCATLWPAKGKLQFPIGMIDLPLNQEQRPLVLDLVGKQGHLALVGAPQTGKSTLLRTTLLSAMLTHTPDELQFYCVDHGGGTLHAFEGAPHVAGVAGRHDEERTRRAIAEVNRLVEYRERIFRELGIGSAADFRRLRDEGALPEGTRAADIVLVIDNWGAVRATSDDVDAVLIDIAARGLGVGIHLILTVNRWADIRMNLRDNIQTRLELRLNDPAESEVNRQIARTLQGAVPGRGVVAPGLLFHTALPRHDGYRDLQGRTGTQEALIEGLAEHWRQREPAPALRVLPGVVRPEEMQATGPDPYHAMTPTEVPIGIGELDLAPVGLDLCAGDPHFMVLGDGESGRTSFLRMWMRGLAERQSSWDVRFLVVDYRRGLMDAVPEEYLGAQAGDADTAAAYAAQLADKLKERLPPPDITARELRERSWWSGPELYLVVDDYDLVVSSSTSRGPLAPLMEFLAQGRDLGFHVVLSRRVGGAGRSLMTDPMLGRLKELGAGGLVMSGDPKEGVVLGDQRAVPRPPGRGVLVRRRKPPVLVQSVLVEDHQEHPVVGSV